MEERPQHAARVERNTLPHPEHDPAEPAGQEHALGRLRNKTMGAVTRAAQQSQIEAQATVGFFDWLLAPLGKFCFDDHIKVLNE